MFPCRRRGLCAVVDAAGRACPRASSPGAGRISASATTTAVHAELRTNAVIIRDHYVAPAALRKQRLVTLRAAQLIEFFKTHPCIDCGETDLAGPSRARVRPSERKALRYRAGPQRPAMERTAGRDSQVRGRLCKLSSSPNGSEGPFCARGGSSTVEPRPSKAMMRVRFPSAALARLGPELSPSAPGRPPVCAPRRGSRPPRRPVPVAAMAQTSCPGRRPG